VNHRVRSLATVATGLAVLHALVPEAAARETWLTLVVLPIGYGHLLGGWLFAGSRMRLTGLEAAFAGASILSLLCAYTWALHVETVRWFVLVPMLLISAWHIVENDLALARAYRNGLRLRPLPRGAGHHAIVLAATGILGVLAIATPTGAYYLQLYFDARPPILLTTIPDLATAVLMVHAISWIFFFLDRASALPALRATRLRRRLFWLHGLPLGANAMLYACLPAIHFYIASATLYLFWSVLHAFQTALVRRTQPRASASAALAWL